MNKVLGILRSTPSVELKSSDYEKRIRTDLYEEMIRPLEDGVRKLENEITDALDMSLNTDMNKGVIAPDRPTIQARIKKAIQLKYQKGVLELELQLLGNAFDELFEEEEEEAVAPVKRTRRSTTAKAEATVGTEAKAENTGTPEY